MVAQMTALGRAGVADDIGRMIALLLSDDNRRVNGQRIEVSGGMVLQGQGVMRGVLRTGGTCLH